jgi:Concanavalin A-like lectin/glucanases superfamily
LARSFNGTSDAIFNILNGGTVSGTWTLSVWVYTTSSTSDMKITGSRDPSDFSFDLSMNYPLTGNFHSDIGNGSTWINTSADTINAYSLNTWHNIVYAVTPTGVSIYVDGLLDTSYTWSNSTPLLANATHQLAIGWNNDSDSGNNHWAGRIAEYGIWNVALSAGEVESLAGPPGALPKDVRPSSLQVYLPLWGVGPGPEPDLSGNGNVGILPVQWSGNVPAAISGLTGYSLLLNGVNGYFSAPASTVSFPYTICGWFLVLAYNGGGDSNPTLFETKSGSAIPLAINGTTHLLEVFAGGSWNTGGSAIPTGTWFYVALVCQSSSTTAYLNGTQVISVASAVQTGGPTLTVGARHDVLQYPYSLDGLVTGCAFWNSVVSGTNIANIYTGTNPNTLNPAAYWSCGTNGGNGNTLNDDSGNGNTGTLVGPTYANGPPVVPYTRKRASVYVSSSPFQFTSPSQITYFLPDANTQWYQTPNKRIQTPTQIQTPFTQLVTLPEVVFPYWLVPKAADLLQQGQASYKQSPQRIDQLPDLSVIYWEQKTTHDLTSRVPFTLVPQQYTTADINLQFWEIASRIPRPTNAPSPPIQQLVTLPEQYTVQYQYRTEFPIPSPILTQLTQQSSQRYDPLPDYTSWWEQRYTWPVPIGFVVPGYKIIWVGKTNQSLAWVGTTNQQIVW